MSIPDQRWSVHFTWSPGAYKLPTAPGGSWRKDGPGWEKAETKFTATSGLPACVCVSCVASIYARVCSSVSCVTLKTCQRSKHFSSCARGPSENHTQLHVIATRWQPYLCAACQGSNECT